MTVKSSTILDVHLPPALWYELAAVLMMLSEAIWISAWYVALIAPEISWLRTLVVLAVVLIFSHYTARVLGGSGSAVTRGRLLFLLWIIVCLTGSLLLLIYSGQGVTVGGLIPRLFLDLSVSGSLSVFWHLLAITLLLWRAVSLASRPMSRGYNVSSFQTGTGIFLLYGLIFGYLERPEALTAFGLFLVTGLSGMTFARVAQLGETRGGRLPQLNFNWLLGVLLIAAACALTALLAGWLIRDDVAQLLAAAVAGLIAIVLVIFIQLATPILNFIINTIYQLGLRYITDFELSSENTQRALEEAVNDTTDTVDTLQVFAEAGRLPLLGTILLVIIILTLVALRWRSWQRRPVLLEEGVEPADSSAARGTPQTTAFESIRQRIFSPRRLFAAARVRRVYAQLMDLSAKMKKPRSGSVTPLEFLPELKALLPNRADDLETITAAYLKVRYGELPENEQEVQHILQAWNRVKSEGNRARKPA